MTTSPHLHPKRMQSAERRKQRVVLSALCLLQSALGVFAVSLPPAKLEGLQVEDLPAPYNLQAVTTKNSVGLSWAWEPPDPGPHFQSFGFEIFRDDVFFTIVGETAYTDFNVPIGAHTYKVRAKGGSKDLGKKVAHMSGWSEPASATLQLTCAGAPVIHLTVEPTKNKYSAIPALRLHFMGDVQAPAGCHVDHVLFHIDSGMSTERSGPLTVDNRGRFDEFIDAMGAEDESVSGGASFAISVTAKDEAGGTTSNVFTINLEQANPYAPK
jgi:hypothetical protein